MNTGKSAPIKRHLSPGQHLFYEFDPSSSMFLVQQGTLSIRKEEPNGYIELAQVHANQVLGELSFFDRQARSASAVAISEVDVLELTFESLDAMWTQIPDYMKTIMKSVAERLRKTNEKIGELQGKLEEAEKAKAPAAESPRKRRSPLS